MNESTTLFSLEASSFQDHASIVSHLEDLSCHSTELDPRPQHSSPSDPTSTLSYLSRIQSLISLHLKSCYRASLVAQWYRICLTIWETWVRFLIQGDPACYGETRPSHHSYWACALDPGSCNYWAHGPQLLKPTCPRAHTLQQEKPPQRKARKAQLECSPRSLQLERSPCSNEDPAQPKIKQINKTIKRKKSYNMFSIILRTKSKYLNEAPSHPSRPGQPYWVLLCAQSPLAHPSFPSPPGWVHTPISSIGSQRLSSTRSHHHPSFSHCANCALCQMGCLQATPSGCLVTPITRIPGIWLTGGLVRKRQWGDFHWINTFYFALGSVPRCW